MGLARLLEELGWTVEKKEPILGGYAATLVRMTARTATGEPVRAVYKRLAPGRTQELALYRDLLGQVPHGVPKLYGTVEEPEEQGLLMEEAGEAVKPLFRALDAEGKKRALRRMTAMLAGLHVALEAPSQAWLREGRAAEYPFHSSVAWAQEALQELAFLQEQGLAGVTESMVAEMRRVADVFYPRYPALAAGRTTFTHGDPHMENLLTDGGVDGGFRLIDWEFACVSLPQRDLSILLQDVLEDELHEFALQAYQEELRRRGFLMGNAEFRRGFAACLLDNSLMMLGWEIQKYRNGHLTLQELEEIVGAKTEWVRHCFVQVSEHLA